MRLTNIFTAPEGGSRVQAADLTASQAAFFDMLEQGGVRASARYADVSEHFGGDPRYTGVPPDERLNLFRSYIRMLNERKDLRLNAAEEEFLVRCPPVPFLSFGSRK